MKATERYTVVTFGCFVALLVLLSAFFADNRRTDVDELALYNPAYVVSQVEIRDAAVVVASPDGSRYEELRAILADPKSQVEAEIQPPVEAVRVDGVVKLSEIEAGHATARIERHPQIRVTTPALPGAFAASFPLHSADRIATVSWVQLRVRVLSGMVGLAVNNRSTGIVARTTKPICQVLIRSTSH